MCHGPPSQQRSQSEMDEIGRRALDAHRFTPTIVVVSWDSVAFSSPSLLSDGVEDMIGGLLAATALVACVLVWLAGRRMDDSAASIACTGRGRWKDGAVSRGMESDIVWRRCR